MSTFRRSGHQALELIIILPRTLFLLGGIVQALCTSQSLDVEIGDPGSVCAQFVVERNADFVVGVKHHVVLPQAALAVVDTQDALLHLHLLWSGAPRERIILSPFRAFTSHWTREGHTVLRMCKTLLLRFADGTTAGEVIATPGVLIRDTPGKC